MNKVYCYCCYCSRHLGPRQSLPIRDKLALNKSNAQQLMRVTLFEWPESSEICTNCLGQGSVKLAQTVWAKVQ